MRPLRRQGWEAAVSLLDGFADRLRPRAYSLCLMASRVGPDALNTHRARRLVRLHAATVEVRR